EARSLSVLGGPPRELEADPRLPRPRAAPDDQTGVCGGRLERRPLLLPEGLLDPLPPRPALLLRARDPHLDRAKEGEQLLKVTLAHPGRGEGRQVRVARDGPAQARLEGGAEPALPHKVKAPPAVEELAVVVLDGPGPLERRPGEGDTAGDGEVAQL